ncbi:MAG: HD-GYP domain-containing protein [Spirochaetota bacterium]|jgi:HD-GYP domain-containing protein (c-di-GMP phosphodiesterase class II)
MAGTIKKIPVEDLKPGMRFDKPVFIDSNNMLVGANVTIKESDIKRLMKWGISEIETMGNLASSENDMRFAQKIDASISADAKKIVDQYSLLLLKRKELMDVHREACRVVGDVYNAIKNDEMFTTDSIEGAAKNIIKLMEEDNNIVLFLYGLEEGKNYLVAHSVNVTFYALLIGTALKYTQEKLRELALGTLLLDAGMVKMPAYIAYKQSNLSDHEFNLIKTHPLHGYRLIKQLGKIREKSALVGLQHHEYFDGKGYPRSLKGNQIDEYARIAAIADSYEAQISSRSYREKQSFYHAMKNLLSSGVNRFDPVILRVFLSKMSVYPIGSLVELNDSSVGLVIGSVPRKPLRPIIKLIFDSEKNRLSDLIIINLLEETALFVNRVLDEKEAGVSLLDVL